MNRKIVSRLRIELRVIARDLGMLQRKVQMTDAEHDEYVRLLDREQQIESDIDSRTMASELTAKLVAAIPWKLGLRPQRV